MIEKIAARLSASGSAGRRVREALPSYWLVGAWQVDADAIKRKSEDARQEGCFETFACILTLSDIVLFFWIVVLRRLGLLHHLLQGLCADIAGLCAGQLL